MMQSSDQQNLLAFYTHYANFIYWRFTPAEDVKETELLRQWASAHIKEKQSIEAFNDHLGGLQFKLSNLPGSTTVKSTRDKQLALNNGLSREVQKETAWIFNQFKVIPTDSETVAMQKYSQYLAQLKSFDDKFKSSRSRHHARQGMVGAQSDDSSR